MPIENPHEDYRSRTTEELLSLAASSEGERQDSLLRELSSRKILHAPLWLQELLHDQSAMVRLLAALTLLNTPPSYDKQVALNILAALLASQDKDVRFFAARALCNTSMGHSLFQVHLGDLLLDGFDLIRLQCVRFVLLPNTPPAIRQIVTSTLAGDPSSIVQSYLAQIK